MFTVTTDHPREGSLLEEQHPRSNKHYFVSTHEVQPVSTMIRSILFECFRGSPPLLAKKVTEFSLAALNMTLSLTLLR